MFLIEYKKGEFINAKRLDWININKGKVGFTIQGDNESSFFVDPSYQDSFLNHLQSLNDNIVNVQSKFNELSNTQGDL